LSSFIDGKERTMVEDVACSCVSRWHPCDFLADRTNGLAYATVLRLSVCLSSVTLCIVSKWCVLEETLPLRAYWKLSIRIDWY